LTPFTPCSAASLGHGGLALLEDIQGIVAVKLVLATFRAASVTLALSRAMRKAARPGPNGKSLCGARQRSGQSLDRFNDVLHLRQVKPHHG
jgi:hypothetical protein